VNGILKELNDRLSTQREIQFKLEQQIRDLGFQHERTLESIKNLKNEIKYVKRQVRQAAKENRRAAKRNDSFRFWPTDKARG
jgi:septal ring factor EnvC (AmiA/AmiB activator)